MISFYKEAKIATKQSLHSTQIKLCCQKSQKKVQDSFDMVSLNNNSFDVDTCVYYKHRCLVPGMDIYETARYNTSVSKKRAIVMTVWTNQATHVCDTKP